MSASTYVQPQSNTTEGTLQRAKSLYDEGKWDESLVELYTALKHHRNKSNNEMLRKLMVSNKKKRAQF